MTPIINKIGDNRLTSISLFGLLSIFFLLAILFTSCEEDLDVQLSYPFTVEVMPYGDKIAKGQTVELRFEIKPEGNYANTMYTIRYFQFDGEGALRLVNGPTLVPNDHVILDNKVFRLNYTAKSDESHEFTVYIEDNFGTRWEQSFEFNNKNNDDNNDSGKLVATPIDWEIDTTISQ